MDLSLEEQFLTDARKQIVEERERVEKEDEESRQFEELLASMKTCPFWHYCEVCGKKEFITDEDAFNSGWDYPPKMGFFWNAWTSHLRKLSNEGYFVLESTDVREIAYCYGRGSKRQRADNMETYKRGA